MDGKPVNFSGPRDALDHGVAMVHQELNQVLRRNVMENMWLGRFPTKGGLVNTRKMYNDTKAVFERLNIDVDPRTVIGNLSVSKRQMVEIAKAVSYNARILVLDEPTSSLTEDEVEHLFRIIDQLTAEGVGIIYISHKMDEILRISDDVTVMRDGQWVATKPAKELTMDEIIRLMVNREMSNRFPPKNNTPGDVLLEVEGVSGAYEPTCHEVSFQLHAGEVLGVAGLVGSRRTELLNTIFGYFTRGEGTMKLHGKEIVNANSAEARKNGFALITEERRATGIFPQMSITFNSIIANVGNYGKFLLSGRKMNKDTDWVIDAIRVKTPSQAHAHQEPVRRQPAEGHHRPLAADEPGSAASGRADARHRHRRQVRDLPADPATGGGRQGRYDGLQRNAGAAGHLRPHTGHVQRPPGGDRRARQGLWRHTRRAGDHHGACREIRVAVRDFA